MAIKAYWRLDEIIPDNGVKNEVNGFTLGVCDNVTFGQPSIVGESTSAFFRTDLQSAIYAGINKLVLDPTCTVEAWIRLTNDYTIALKTIFSIRDSFIDSKPWFGLRDRKLSVVTHLPSTLVETEVQSVHDIIFNEWNHVVWTSDGFITKLYINGVLDATASQIKSAGWLGQSRIGFDQSNTAGAFYGYIDEVAIYSHVLSAERILAHFLLAPISTHRPVFSGRGKFSKVLNGLGSLDSIEVVA